MIKRTIYIGNPAYLKLKRLQLCVEDTETKQIKGIVPIEDMAVLLLDHPQITITNQVLLQLQAHKVAVISCDAQHLPLGLMLPLYGHTELSANVKHQLAASEPLKKQLWKQTVEQKIKNQAQLLALVSKDNQVLLDYAQEVKSGDTTNREGMAAQYYWSQVFDNFARHPQGETPNNALNFGYAILRSMVARALVSSGLLPVLGIFHRNKYNPFCLADDIMEPYRPFVDKLVYNLKTQGGIADELNTETKAQILQVATHDVLIDGKARPLFVAISTTTASLLKCFTGELRHIKYPELD